MPSLGEQLQPALERRQKLDRLAEERARMRVEREDRRSQSRRRRGLEDARVTAVDAVEGSDRDRAACRLELVWAVHDVHSAASTSSSPASLLGSELRRRNRIVDARTGRPRCGAACGSGRRAHRRWRGCTSRS